MSKAILGGRRAGKATANREKFLTELNRSLDEDLNENTQLVIRRQGNTLMCYLETNTRKGKRNG